MFIYLCLFLPLASTAQKNEGDKIEINKTIQGGVFIDRTLMNRSPFGKEYSHNSANKIGFGLIWDRDEFLTQALIDVSYYQNNFSVFDGSLFLIELEYFKSTFKKEISSHNFYAGYITNLNFTAESITPFDTQDFIREETCICLGAGIKAMYSYTLKNNMSLMIGSDLNLFDFGIASFVNKNQINASDMRRERAFEFKVFRSRIGIDFGLVF